VFRLLRIKGFLPYIFVVFLNAFTDLGHKIIIQNTVFKVYDGSEQIILTAIVNGLILLPFILLFSPAGFISDKYKKEKVMQISAILAVIVTLLITLSYYLGLFWVSFFLTFLLATQSAIYSPAKYGYIKELLGSNNIAAGNGAVQAVTIVAILGGMFLYSIGFESLLQNQTSEATILQDIAPLGIFLFLGSLLELYLAYRLPNKTIELSTQEFTLSSYLKGRYLQKNIKLIKRNEIILLSIIGLSIFWALSQVVLAVFPAYIKEHLAITNVVVIQGLMGVSAIGIIIGSILASKLSKNYIEVGIVPIGSIGVFITIVLIPFLNDVVSSGINFFFFGIFGGLLIVPLNSLIQYHASNKRLGLILSGNNFIQNIFMFSFLVLTVGFSFINITAVEIFSILAFIAFLSSIYTIYKLPQSLIKLFVSLFFSIRYKLIVEGIENIPQNGGVLLLGNHISWLDWAFVQMASPRAIRFVMERSIYEKKLLKPFLNFFKVIPISSSGGKKSLEEVAKYLEIGEVVCIFPEGSISRSGHLGEFKRGFEIATAQVENGVIIPFYIGGLWGTKWSRSNSNFKERENSYKKDVIISFGKPIDIKMNATQVKQKVFELSSDSWDRYINGFQNIDRIFIDTVKRKGSAIALVDSSGEEYSYTKMMTMALFFRNIIKKHPEQNIGLLVPTTSIGAIVNIATILAGKTVVNLNYTASKEAIVFGIDEAKIKNIYTSRRFCEKLQERGVAVEEILKDVHIVYLEDIKKNSSKLQIIPIVLRYGLIKFAPTFLIKAVYCSKNTLDTIGAILFSSGSEGNPKGVMLSHRNLLTNVKQISEMLNITEKEVFLGSLPIFHAFGLTVTTLLPLIEGIKLVSHPDPTDGLGIGKAVAKNRITFMCATSTFIRLYLKNKKLTPLMFESLNMVFAGAEKLNPLVADEFKQRFGVEIYEGYGATECSPVISANIPDNLDMNYWQTQIGHKRGTIGMPLPGCAVKIVDFETLEELPINENGLIIVTGSNVMVGYLNNKEKTNDVLVNLDGKLWYKTGDKGHIDEDGFITIVDRYSRFAKVAGEMISLTAVENKIYEICHKEEDLKLLTVNLPDEKKGERIVLLINKNIDNLKQKCIEFGMEPLWIPSEIKLVENIPLLGSGKVDFAGAKRLAL
jgi:acyl-[acyl-carrier-protein]-phospholipid O-acyltransferase / long-chain-fatty-acid--[acyl-carrier-protein] ligase